MALTSNEEEKVRQIITFFENRKKISQLPLATGVNPFDMITAVMDADGETRQAALATLLPYVEEQCSYGVQWDKTVSSTALTRIGSTDLHKRLPVQGRMLGCLLADTGEVGTYLNPGDWTIHDRTGANGQVMVEIPAHYRKCTTSGNTLSVRISEYPLPGYRLVPRMYVSAYEATVDRTTSSTPRLASVVNTTVNFRGGNNNADWDNTYRTLLGRPASQISRTNFRAYARNRGEAGLNGAGWNCMTYDAQKAIFWLFAIEYATRDTQADFNASKSGDGYAQGGLGDGVTNLNGTKWSNFNNYYPFVPCGYTDSIGNGTGTVELSMPEEYDTSILKTYVPRYRGIENPFGHIWQWTDGVNVRINPGDEGTSEVFVCSDPSKFSDTGYDGYSHVGNEARTGGYIKEIIFGDGGEIISSVVGGSSSTFFPDYHYTNIPSAVQLRGLRFGGSAASGAGAGLASASSYYVPSYAGATIGSRLCFIPE